jgi:hypothetical protein
LGAAAGLAQAEVKEESEDSDRVKEFGLFN